MGSLANVGLGTIPTYKTIRDFNSTKILSKKKRMDKTLAILLALVVVTTVSCQPAGKKVSQDLTKPDDKSEVNVEDKVQADDAKAATNLSAAPEIEAMYKQLMESQDQVTKLRDGESGAVSTLKSALKTLLETTMNEFFYGMVPSVEKM